MARRHKTKKRPSKAKSSKHSQRRCFTVMPFGGWFDDYYTSVFVPAIEAAGLEAERADDLYGPSAIINDIWTMTKRCDIVLADLTGKNPNVFYELGLAHAIAKPAVLVTASLDDVPFDLKSLRVIVYDKNDPNWGEDLGTAITEALRETLDRPAESVLPTFLGVPSGSAPSTPKGDNLELLQIRQELRSLRNQISHSSVIEGPIGPTEAQIVIRELVERGYPPEVIRQRLQVRGAPLSWIDAEIRRARTKTSTSRARKGFPSPSKASTSTVAKPQTGTVTIIPPASASA